MYSMYMNTKQCHRCKKVKATSEYNKNVSRKDGLGSSCRVCMSELRKEHYEANKSKVIDDVKARRQSLHDKIWQLKNNSKCKDCGNEEPIVMEFDHLPEFEKTYNIAEMPMRGFSWDRIQEEIAKCEIVCANCHRIRTWKRNPPVRNMVIRVDEPRGLLVSFNSG